MPPALLTKTRFILLRGTLSIFFYFLQNFFFSQSVAIFWIHFLLNHEYVLEKRQRPKYVDLISNLSFNWRCWPDYFCFIKETMQMQLSIYKSIVTERSHPSHSTFLSRQSIFSMYTKYDDDDFMQMWMKNLKNLTLITHAYVFTYLQYPQPTQHFFICNWLSLNFKQTSKSILYTFLHLKLIMSSSLMSNTKKTTISIQQAKTDCTSTIFVYFSFFHCNACTRARMTSRETR